MRRKGEQPHPALCPQLVNKVARLIFNGFDNEEIGLVTGLAQSHVKALRQGVDYKEVRCAVIYLKDNAIEKVKAGKGKLTGLIWFLERRYPRQFARPDVQLSLSSGPTTNNTLVISAEQAKEIVNRSKATLSEIDQLIAAKNPEIALDSQ